MEIEKNITYQTIATFSAWEIQHFRKWLRSPAHNTRPELVAVFDALHQGQVKARIPGPEQVFHAAFPDQELDLKKLRHLLSWLMTQVKNFFIHLEMDNNPALSSQLLIQQFRKRGFEPGFRQSLRDARLTLEKADVYSTETHLQKFMIDLEEHHWNIPQKRAQDMPFEVLAGSLTAYFATKMLQLGCMYRAQEAMGKQSPDTLPRLDAILQAFPTESLQHTPETALYLAGFHLLSKTDESYWPARFHTLLHQHIQMFPADEARDLLMMAINYGIGRSNRGDRDYLEEVLTIYDLGFRQRLLLDKRGYLSKYTYNNVLLIMISRKHWERAEQFLENYREQLAPDERDSIYRYNRSVFLFRKGNYEAAQDILRELSFSDPMYNLEARRMLLRIYFENNAIEALESLLDNLLTWVRRHSEIGYHGEMYRNLARFTGKLLKIPPGEKERRRQLAKKIKETPLVADREWLLEKVG